MTRLDLGSRKLTPDRPAWSASWSSADDPRVVAALEEFLRLCQTGESPSRSEFLGLHPEISEHLADCLDGLEFVRRASSTLMPSSSASMEAVGLPTAALLGDFRIHREVGRGGMGVVYEAEQLSLGRRVALKVLPIAASLDPRQLQRFHIEAQAAALLRHEHIVPVFVVGRDQGAHFLAMQFVSGWSLADVISQMRDRKETGMSAGPTDSTGSAAEPASGLAAEHIDSSQRPDLSPGQANDLDQTALWQPSLSATPHAAAVAAARIGPTPLDSCQGTPQYFRAVAQLGLQAAEALSHAHSVGVLHRDIKPSNLLIDERLHLWVTDFGLARIRDDPGPTRTGDFLGTLRYTSPEQIRGDHSVVDPRSDVYALGVTLYELLTLQPTFACDDRQALLHHILNDQPAAPRKVDPSIPRDLETIVLKAMSREAFDRYHSATDLADDLTRFLGDHPIRARRLNLLDHAAKWSRRHRVAIASASGLLIVTLAVSSAVLWQAKRRTDTALAAEQASKKKADTALAAEQASKKKADTALASLTETRNREHVDYESTLNAMDQFSYARIMRDRASGRVPDREGQETYRGLISFYDNLSWNLSRAKTHSEIAAKAARRVGLYQTILRDPRADRSYHRAISLYQILADREPSFIWIRTGLIDTLREYADGLEAIGRPDAAEDMVRRALDVAEPLLVDKAAAFPCFQKGLVGQFDGLAWWLVRHPPKRTDDPARAVRLARHAVEWEPQRAAFRTTLALAHYRSGDWIAAKAALAESTEVQEEGDPLNWLILAMIHQRQGQSEQAQTRYDQAREWFESHTANISQNREIDGIRREAEHLIPAAHPAQ
jgi:serine/threonine protein kinase